MTHSSIGRLALGAVLAVSLGAWDCGGSDNPGNPDGPGGNNPDAPMVSGPYNHYVTATIITGMNTNDATANSFDLDGDGHGDNALGTILANFSSQLKIDAAIAAALTKGTFVVLHSVHGNLSGGAATWQLYAGQKFTSGMPDLTTGNGNFMIDTTVTPAAALVGSISGGKFTTTTPGNIALQIAISSNGGNPITIPLTAGRIEATLTAGNCTGKIGGGIKKTDLEASLYPAIAQTLTQRFADDHCTPGPCTDTNDATIATFVDTGCPPGCTPCTGSAGDYVVTADEIRCGTIGTVLTPDVDLVKADGSLGKDNVKESVSIGVGFTCTKANFTASGEQ